jgi:hypothetical protein
MRVLRSIVLPTAVRATEFTLHKADGERPAFEVLQVATYHRELADDPDKLEYVARVNWRDSVPLEKAVYEVGLFGNQNTLARPTSPKWRHTIDRLKQVFPNWDAQEK